MTDDFPRVEEVLTLEISKVFYEGDFSHWEFDVVGPDGAWEAGGTGPSMHSVVDAAFDSLYDSPVHDWMKDDANKRGGSSE